MDRSQEARVCRLVGEVTMEPIKQYREFLTLLSKNPQPSSYKDIMDNFKLNRVKVELLLKHLAHYYNNVGHTPGKEHDWEHHLIEINHQGLEYLRNLELQDLAKSQNKFNRIIALTGCVIAFVTLMDFVDRYLDRNIGIPLTSTELISFITGISIFLVLIFLLGRETTNIYFEK